MRKHVVYLSLAVLAVAGVFYAFAQEDTSGTEAKIADALSAAPSSIAEDATVLDWAFDDEGEFVVLREGTNDWSCLPGSPRPMCLDKVFMAWMYAIMSGADLSVTAPGFAYMLQGGETLSNSNPAAMEPAEDYWTSDAPYMMVLLPGEIDISAFSADPAHPLFVMFPGTPYQHLMVPIGDAE